MTETTADPPSRSVFKDQGWVRFPYDAGVAMWAASALPAAWAAVAAPENRDWLRCGGTWFAGVNVLQGGPYGASAGGRPVTGVVVDFLAEALGWTRPDWGPGQVSVCYPGYPQPMPGEAPPAFRYRQRRDAAHVDGLLPEGPTRRRHLREHHAFILGLPLTEVDPGASPLVVWSGSHEVLRAAFRQAVGQTPPEAWGELDLTDIYDAARRRVFETCPRVLLPARPGEATLLHRLTLHGVAPWADSATAGPDGRMIAYFRPELDCPRDWLDLP